MSYLRRHVLKLSLGFIAALVLVIGGYIGWYIHQPVKLSYSLTAIGIKSPIRVSFSHQVGSQLSYHLADSIPGEWKVVHGALGIKAIIFIPAKPLVPGTSYHVVIGHVTEPLTNQVVIATTTVKITAETPSAIESITPANEATGVSVNPTIVIKLKSLNDGLRKLKLSSDTTVALSEPTVSNDDTSYSWHYAGPLPQGVTYHLTLSDLNQTDPTKQVIMTSSFTTVAEPVITATAHDHSYPGQTVTVSFSQPMVQSTNVLKFNFGGSGTWTSPTTYTYTPSGLVSNQNYTYSVVKGAASKQGGVVAADHTYTIATPGPAYVIGRSPTGGNIGLGASVSFTFDQPVDHTTAQAAFSIFPYTTGSFSWSGNTMTFHPDGYGYQTSYTATVEPGVKATYGVPSTQAFSVGFTTVLQTVSLNVPLYHQVYALSCASDALSMALAYRGINVSDYDVLMHENYNPRPLDTSTNSWDDPNVMFVGSVTGVTGVTGWGVNAPPIGAAANALGDNAIVVHGITASGISTEVHNNNPVLVWGYSGTHSPTVMKSWNSPDGIVTVALYGHVRTVVGVVGSAANPVGFYLNDPWYGKLYWTAAQLIKNMTLDGQGQSQAVVVH